MGDRAFAEPLRGRFVLPPSGLMSSQPFSSVLGRAGWEAEPPRLCFSLLGYAVSSLLPGQCAMSLTPFYKGTSLVLMRRTA